MFRRYPYWGWLLLGLLLWCINGYQFHLHRQAMLPGQMARTVDRDLQNREEVYAQFILEHDFIRRLFADSLTAAESERINKLPFYLFAYSGDTLKLWNTNTILPGNTDSAPGKAQLLNNEKGVFIARSVRPFLLDNRKKLVVLFPVLIGYPMENNYLKSHFVAADYVPATTKIIPADSATAKDYPVTTKGSGVLFYLRFGSDPQKWSPDGWFIGLLILSVLATLSWLQLVIIYLTRRKTPFVGFITILAIVMILRTALYAYGLPFNLDTLTFFSPLLYASNKYLSSLGDLGINTLCVLWIVVFITRHTPYKRFFAKLQDTRIKKGIAIVLTFALIGYVFLFVGIIRSLVLDSSIAFDVNHFYSVNIYTVLGLLVIGAITGISCLVIYLINVQLSALLKSYWAKYLLVAAIGVLFLFITGNSHDHFYQALVCWVLVFIPLLDVRKFALVSDLFEPHMLFWAVFICAFCTGILQYFNQVKEHVARKTFVDQQLMPARDYVIESTFDKTARDIQKDSLLKGFFYKPSGSYRKLINHRFETQYLTGAINKYQSKIYFFDTHKNGQYNSDSISYNTLWNEKNESASTGSPYLFYKESILERHYYLLFIPIYPDTSANNVMGYAVVTLDLKKQVAQTVYPELLQQANNKASAADNGYAYAVYVNDKLITQTNDYPFTIYLKNDTLKETQYAFYTINNVSELHYKVADKRTIVVIHYHSHVLEMITLFSYIFGMQVTLAIMILLYQLYISYFTGARTSGKYIRLTLRKRVHFSMLAIVLVSFIIIGSVTIVFFTKQYRTSNHNNLQSAMQVAKEAVQEYLKAGNAYESESVFDSVSKSTRFKETITTLANGQTIDINIFNNTGELFAASQDEIYNKGLISNRMRPDAFYQLNNTGKSIVIQDEKVAGLSYLSAYEPLRNEMGVTLGYINVPFFNSEKDLNFQISNILVTLINLYAFIFLFSSLITVLITRWITRSFNVIIEQFGRINLQRNERIKWPYDDEIGLLVTEYNKMVNKVEENAALLARSERESAWREMARQVAHEIKNPLTPMKLNIQYLQQAMKNDNPNIKELTEKVSNSIIEQIDNLSYIASEFSNFAKMPEARPEEMELSALLNKAVELYLNDSHLKVTIKEGPQKLFVVADHSQLLRVCTNLLENAKQAIPEDRIGEIEVSLTSQNEAAIIAVRDNGTGIPAEVAKRIFEPYFTTKSSGTGLGLAMTKKIIEFWKGSIWFETAEGKGSTFFIRLPLIDR